MKKKILRYYWDAGVFLALFNDEPGRADIINQLLTEAESGSHLIYTSTITLTEVVHIRGRDRMTSDTENTIRDALSRSFIKIIDLTRVIAESSRQLLWKNLSLKPKDSIHLASALYVKNSLDGIFSYDNDFTKLNGVFPLKIVEPFVSQTSFVHLLQR